MNPQPSVDDSGVPWCLASECQAYDGKRCRLLGYRAPDGEICPPAVRRMVVTIDQLRRHIAEDKRHSGT